MILLVDDDVDFLDVFTEFFENEGYDVIIAINGDVAIKQYQKHIPKLVLMDVNMPIMNGINAFFKIKAKYDDANIILISGNPRNKEIKNAINFGLVDYLEKPVSPQLLKQLVRQHTNNKLQIMKI